MNTKRIAVRKNLEGLSTALDFRYEQIEVDIFELGDSYSFLSLLVTLTTVEDIFRSIALNLNEVRSQILLQKPKLANRSEILANQVLALADDLQILDRIYDAKKARVLNAMLPLAEEEKYFEELGANLVAELKEIKLEENYENIQRFIYRLFP